MVEPAEVIEILGREGPKGVSIVRCRLLNKNKILERAVVGSCLLYTSDAADE